MLIFCLVDLSIGVNGVLKSPTITVLLLISPFILVSICLTYCGAPMLGAYIFIIVCDIFWRSFSGRLSSTSHLIYLDQMRLMIVGPNRRLTNQFFFSHPQALARNCLMILFFSPLSSKERASNLSTLWIFSCRHCLWGSAWMFLSNRRWYCELWLSFLSFSPKLNLEEKHLSQIVF